MAKDYDINNPDNYRWVKATGQLWKMRVCLFPAFWSILAVPATVVCLGMAIWHGWLIWLVGGVWLVAVLAHLVTLWFEYDIKCPQCGFNPTKRKKDGRSVAPRLLNSRLCGLESCPKCGFSGNP